MIKSFDFTYGSSDAWSSPSFRDVQIDISLSGVGEDLKFLKACLNSGRSLTQLIREKPVEDALTVALQADAVRLAAKLEEAEAEIRILTAHLRRELDR